MHMKKEADSHILAGRDRTAADSGNRFDAHRFGLDRVNDALHLGDMLVQESRDYLALHNITATVWREARCLSPEVSHPDREANTLAASLIEAQLRSTSQRNRAPQDRHPMRTIRTGD